MEKPVKLLITDTHSDKENVDVVEEIFDQAFDLADQLGLDEINHLGDAFNSRTGQALQILLSFQRITEKARERNIKITAIAGNHDKTNQESEESYLDVFKGTEGFFVVGRYHVEEDKINKILHCYIPYFKEDTVYVEILSELTNSLERLLPKDYKAFLYTHIAVNGVKNNGGTKVENSLKYNMFKIFDKVFIGHYHNQSRIGKNIFYIGSGLPKDFGEDDKKGFTIVYNTGRHDFIQARFKKYIKVRFDLDVNSKADILKAMSQYKNSNDFVRFIFVGSREQFVALADEFKRLKKFGIDVKTEDKNILKAMEAAMIGGKITFDYKLILRYFLEFCGNNKDQITPNKRSIGLKYINILKDY